jgi:glutamate---cysteine ligase / carboxylate-amine ligase
MKMLPFKSSPAATIGVELELQIIHPETFALVSRAKDLMRNISQSKFNKQIKPEITQCMIEINTSIHQDINEMLGELQAIQSNLQEQARQIHVLFCGGGTHPFQKWALQKIYPTMRYKSLASRYRYLSKRGTVFGQHIHVGCKSGEDALYLTHALSRYVPHLIAMSASSPFYQGIDTGFFSSRSTIFNSFPLSGVMPFLTTWDEFTSYFYRMKDLGIIETMKDFYWDIRPKPEFGTVEIRVCDTPLTLKKSAQIAAYLQALSVYLLEERPMTIIPEIYYLYSYNRFQASRYAFNGELYEYNGSKAKLIKDDIVDTIKKIEYYANHLCNMGYLSQLVEDVVNHQNDTVTLRSLYKQTGTFQNVVENQCAIWFVNE